MGATCLRGSSKVEPACAVGAQGRNADDLPRQPTSPKKRNKNAALRSEYILGPVLGQGAFGVVHACAKKGSKQMKYAVKMVDKVETPVDEIKAEAEMLQFLDHPNIVKFHGIFYEKFFVCIVMDKYNGGDLIEGMQEYWKKHGQIPCNKIIHVSLQMCLAIEYMHGKQVVHRDVKGDNYLMDRRDLVDEDCKIIITDFGTAQRLAPGKRLSKSVGTRIYWPPEFFDGSYGFKVDVWALGVIMYGLLVGRFPFKGEQDARTKVPRLPPSTPPLCGEYIQGLLRKDEDERFTADQALAHGWLNQAKGGLKFAHKLDKNFKPEGISEHRPNGGVTARRLELLARMQRKEHDIRIVPSSVNKDAFHVENRTTKRTVAYQWFDERTVKHGDPTRPPLIDLSGAKLEVQDAHGMHSFAVVQKMLLEHGIPVAKFGTGGFKTMEEFVAEVQHGSVVLMLDATVHKTLVRVVDVVLLRIAYRWSKKQHLDHNGFDENTSYLVEFQEVYADGRSRNTSRLPGAKKEPHENTLTCGTRILRDVLGFGQDVEIEFDIAHKEVYEEETSSPSYPDVKTVYRKTFLVGNIATSDASVLQEIGICASRCDRFSHTEPSRGIARRFCWQTEAQCVEKGTTLRVPPNTEDVSALVQAPIGFSEEELASFLDSHGIDPDIFGTEGTPTLAEFSTELTQGEASLILRPRQRPSPSLCDDAYNTLLGVHADANDPDIERAYKQAATRYHPQKGGDEKTWNAICKAQHALRAPARRVDYHRFGERGATEVVRLVDIVCVLLKKNNQILVATHEKLARGEAVPLWRLPCGTRRPDENQFLTVQRVLRRDFNLDDSRVVMDPTSVHILEEEKESSRYPGMTTLLRTRFITAYLTRPDALTDGARAREGPQGEPPRARLQSCSRALLAPHVASPHGRSSCVRAWAPAGG